MIFIQSIKTLILTRLVLKKIIVYDIIIMKFYVEVLNEQFRKNN